LHHDNNAVNILLIIITVKKLILKHAVHAVTLETNYLASCTLEELKLGQQLQLQVCALCQATDN